MSKEEPVKKTDLHSEAATVSGTTIFGGRIVPDDYNPLMQGKTAIRTYEKMRRSNATVSEISDLVVQPVRGASWGIQEASSDERDLEIADFVYKVYFENPYMTWDQFMEEGLEMLPLGFSLFERTYYDFMYNGKKLLAMRYHPISQLTVDKWETADGEPGIYQQTATGHTASVKMEDLLVFTFRQKGDNYEGRSILRGAYTHWYYNDNFYRIEAIAHERTHVGIPYVKTPQGVDDEGKRKAEELAMNIRANEKQFVSYPEGYEIGFLDMKAGSTTDIQPSITHHNVQIGHAAMAAFLLAGSTPNGSRATSVDLSSMFLHALKAVANQFVDKINKDIKTMVDLNFSNVKNYPKLFYTELERDDVEVISAAYQRFAQVKGITPDSTTEAWIRTLLGAPDKEMPDEGDQITTAVNAATGDSVQATAMNGAQIEALKAIISEVSAGTMSKESAKVLIQIGFPTVSVDLANELVDKVEVQQAVVPKPPVPSEANNASKKKAKKVAAEVNDQWRRKLTAAEQKVDLEGLDKRIDRGEDALKKSLTQISSQQVDNIVEQVRLAAESANPLEALQSLEVAFTDQYKDVMQGELRRIFEYAKTRVADEMGVNAPATTSAEVSKLSAMTSNFTDQHSDTMKSLAKNAATSAIIAEQPIDVIVNSVRDQIVQKSTEQITGTAAASMIGTANQGRAFVQETYDDLIYAYQYSAILDDVTCPTCYALDQYVVAKDDPDYRNLMPPQHFNCRCIWVEIMKTEDNKPEITGIPNEIDRTSDVSTFEPLSQDEADQIANQ